MTRLIAQILPIISIVLFFACACTRASLDAANELPFGAVDTPQPNAVVKPYVVVGGWALDDRGVRAVRIFVDGRLNTETPLNVQRPDATPRTSRYGHGHTRHGWNVRVDLGPNPGMRTIRVEVVDDDGAARDIGIFALTVERW
ncbi:MAG: hypothetical protein LC753_02435 [Acidobacteria bacterium]|nr:hypothetical protein [Acidobacteriota bacterium]MCA1649162.1 hypothetical protein [Acidobacteriota bacterium]